MHIDSTPILWWTLKAFPSGDGVDETELDEEDRKETALNLQQTAVSDAVSEQKEDAKSEDVECLHFNFEQTPHRIWHRLDALTLSIFKALPTEWKGLMAVALKDGDQNRWKTHFVVIDGTGTLMLFDESRDTLMASYILGNLSPKNWKFTEPDSTFTLFRLGLDTENGGGFQIIFESKPELLVFARTAGRYLSADGLAGNGVFPHSLSL